MKIWLIRHPWILGLLFVLAALFAFDSARDSAKEARRFRDAKPTRAEVVSVDRKSQLPPRWNAQVSWRERGALRSANLVVGPGGGWFDPGAAPKETVEILVAPDSGGEAILAGRLATSHLSVFRKEFETTDFWMGIAFSAAALLCFVFGGAIKRQAEGL